MPNEQRMQDFINLERPIQDFLGWVLSLDQAQFTEVLEQAGHHAPKYQAEKWAEFKANALAFVWNWTPAFVAAWNSLDQQLYTSPGLTMLVFDKSRSNVPPLMFRANEGDLTHTFVMGTTRQGMSARLNPVAGFAAEPDQCMKMLLAGADCLHISDELYALAKETGLQVAAREEEPTVQNLVDEWRTKPALINVANMIAAVFIPK